MCVSNQEPSPCEARDMTTTPTDRMKSQGVELSDVITHGKHTKPIGQGQGDILFNPIITDFVKTSRLFHVIIIELKRQKHIYSIIIPESKKIMSSNINLNRKQHKGA